MIWGVVAVLAVSALGVAHGQSVEMTVSSVSMSVPAGNSMPWAVVEGTVENHAAGYPVIIQIYSEGGAAGNSEGAVHFAQVDVSEDGSYEHRFRVLDITDGQRTAVFEGDYAVKIFKFSYAQGIVA